MSQPLTVPRGPAPEPEPEREPAPKPRAPLSLKIIAGILVTAALYLGREFFIPLALAASFHALFRPVVRLLERWRLPTAAAAAIVVLGAIGIGTGAAWALSAPAGDWVNKAPTSLKAARDKLRKLGRPIDKLTDAAKGAPSSGAVEGSPSPEGRGGQGVRTQAPTPSPSGSLYVQLLGGATSLVSGLVEVILLLYLMLAAGDLFLRKLVKVLPTWSDKRTAAEILGDTESIVARYLLATALINTGQAIAVGLCMWAIGLPDPLIWGLLTFALEFIPYLGGATMVGLLLITGFTAFDTAGHALLAPGIYLVITTIQNNVVSPYVYGGRLKLNPLAVLVFAMFWWFIWGVAGVFLSVPIAAMMKALGDQIPKLEPVGEFLGE